LSAGDRSVIYRGGGTYYQSLLSASDSYLWGGAWGETRRTDTISRDSLPILLSWKACLSEVGKSNDLVVLSAASIRSRASGRRCAQNAKLRVRELFGELIEGKYPFVRMPLDRELVWVFPRSQCFCCSLGSVQAVGTSVVTPDLTIAQVIQDAQQNYPAIHVSEQELNAAVANIR